MSPIFAIPDHTGCQLAPESSNEVSDADLVCEHCTMHPENFYMLKNVTTDDVEVANFVHVEVDLDENVFKKLKNMNSLMVYRSKLKVFRPESLVLNNFQVHHSSFPDNSTFDNCCRNLNKLLLKNNTGLHLKGSAFTKLTRLQQLKLSYMPVEYITKDLLKGLTSLKMLKLHSLSFKRIDSDAFEDLPKLKEMSIEEHEIEEINTDIFKTLRNLKVLTIYAKKLKPIPLDALRELSHLRELGLPLKTWKEMDVDQIPLVFPKLTSFSYTEDWEAKDDYIYKPLFRKITTVLLNKN